MALHSVHTRRIARWYRARWGEAFGASKIDVGVLPIQLPVAAGALAVADAGIPNSWRMLDRPVLAVRFRVLRSVARGADNSRKAKPT